MRAWLLNLFRRPPAPPLVTKPAALPGTGSPAPEVPPEWTAEDRGALLHFLRGASGTKLLQTMRCQEEILKGQACDDTEKRVDHARGQAVGYRKGIASLIVLSAPPPPKEETATSPDRGSDELRDQLSHN